MDQHAQNQIEEEIKIYQFSLVTSESYELTHSNSWVKELLAEIEAELDPEDRTKEGEIIVKLDIKRKSDDAFKEHLIIRGQIAGHFQTQCIRCLTATDMTIKKRFKVCFLPDYYEKMEEYEEVDEVFCDNQALDAYFQEAGGKIKLKELIGEQLVMSIDPLPLHDENCKGLCSICGTNLNTDTCKHSTAKNE